MPSRLVWASQGAIPGHRCAGRGVDMESDQAKEQITACLLEDLRAINQVADEREIQKELPIDHYDVVWFRTTQLYPSGGA